MAEKDQIYSSSIKSTGIFDFKSFYKFCYEWLVEEAEMNLTETSYKEKLSGNEKEIEVKWEGYNKLTDYFKFDIKVVFEVKRLKEVEIPQNGKKIKTNEGEVKVAVKGILTKDYSGKFETSAWRKFLRGIYEKWVIPSRIDQFETKIFDKCDEFLAQAKAYLDLEGKR
jgi:hypothetical protein